MMSMERVGWMKKYFTVTFAIFLILWGYSVYTAPVYHLLSLQKDSQVQQIDQQIQELEERKIGFESRVLRHEDQADRLQFDDQTYLETRRHIQLAEENRAKANAVQREIDRLLAEKEKLLSQFR
jgi:hypothetical protein